MSTFRTRIQSTEIGGRAWRMRVLRDRQQFDDNDRMAERNGVSPSGWSHFGHLWASGLGLARAIVLQPVAGLRVLELGCGLGLPSLVLAGLGADITASDHHPLAARFLTSNARRNGIVAPQFCDLPWGGRDPSLGRFDLIIAADVLYERDHAPLLVDMIEQHGCLNGEVLLADPGRGGTAAFSRALVQRGYLAAPVSRAPEGIELQTEHIRMLRFVR